MILYPKASLCWVCIQKANRAPSSFEILKGHWYCPLWHLTPCPCLVEGEAEKQMSSIGSERVERKESGNELTRNGRDSCCRQSPQPKPTCIFDIGGVVVRMKFIMEIQLGKCELSKWSAYLSNTRRLAFDDLKGRRTRA